MQKLKYMKGAFMKMIRDKLMMCAAFVGLISVNAEAMQQSSSSSSSQRNELRKSPEQSADERDAAYSTQEAQAIARSLHAKIAEFIAYAEQRSEIARQEIANKIEQVDALLGQSKQDEVMVELIEMGDSLHALKTTVLNKDHKGSEQEKILRNIEFIERVLRQTKSKYTQGTLTEDELRNTYILIYAYSQVPGSIVNAVFAGTTGGDRPPFNLEKYGENLGSAYDRRAAKYEAAEPSNCPDAHVLGRTVRELFPYFSQRSFNAGMAVTNVATGEKRPMTTVKLNGRWWNVYAMDKQTQGEWESFTPVDFQDHVYDETGYNRRGYNRQGFNVHGSHQNGWYDQSWGYQSRNNLDVDGYNRAGYRTPTPQSWDFRNRQGYDIYGNHAQNGYNRTWDLNSRLNQTIFYWPTSIRQVAAPYAFRFDQSAHMTNSLLAEDGQGYYDPNQMRYVQPEQSVVAKKLHRAITSPDNGVFWQRDTAFDDGQSQFCTYKSSTYTGVPRQGMYMYGNFERTDCTFIFEPAAEPNASEFDALKNGFMKRVYAERRAYYMRNQNLGHYYIDPQDDPVAAQAKVMGEFKERIARDRIYQLQDPAQRRADGRIYSVTPSRVYKATRNMRNAASPEEIELHNSELAHDAVVFRNPQAEEVENRANVRQTANIAAQYRAAQALRGSAPSRAAGESKGDEF